MMLWKLFGHFLQHRSELFTILALSGVADVAMRCEIADLVTK